MTRTTFARCAFLATSWLVATGCASSPEPLGQSAVMDTAAPSADASAPAPTTSAATGQGGPLSAKLIEVEPAKDASGDMHASITFDNPGSGDCKVTAYTLAWPGGSKTVKVDDFTVHANLTAKRSMKMHPNDGDLAKLTVADGTVTLKSDCPGPSAASRAP